MERLYIIQGRSLLSFRVIQGTNIVKVFGHPSIKSINKIDYITQICLNDLCTYVGEV
jgi:hypothetical protein